MSTRWKDFLNFWSLIFNSWKLKDLLRCGPYRSFSFTHTLWRFSSVRLQLFCRIFCCGPFNGQGGSLSWGDRDQFGGWHSPSISCSKHCARNGRLWPSLFQLYFWWEGDLRKSLKVEISSTHLHWGRNCARCSGRTLQFGHGVCAVSPDWNLWRWLFDDRGMSRSVIPHSTTSKIFAKLLKMNFRLRLKLVGGHTVLFSLIIVTMIYWINWASFAFDRFGLWKKNPINIINLIFIHFIR